MGIMGVFLIMGDAGFLSSTASPYSEASKGGMKVGGIFRSSDFYLYGGSSVLPTFIPPLRLPIIGIL